LKEAKLQPSGDGRMKRIKIGAWNQAIRKSKDAGQIKRRGPLADPSQAAFQKEPWRIKP
jgi:hypothetical protein